jgi:hypothetical protein
MAGTVQDDEADRSSLTRQTKEGILRRSCSVALLVAAAALAFAPPAAATYQFEVLGASADWVLIRENVRARTSDTNACTYPGLDPSEYVGAFVQLFRLSEPQSRGQLTILEQGDEMMVLYSTARNGLGCSSPAEIEANWQRISARAAKLGINPQRQPVPVLLGTAVPARSCAVIAIGRTASQSCRRVHTQRIGKEQVRIGVSLSSVPQPPDRSTCQYIGYRLIAAVQIEAASYTPLLISPGGVTSHYDCRDQQFSPMRLYRLGDLAVLLGAFQATNIADRSEYPFFIVVPASAAAP